MEVSKFKTVHLHQRVECLGGVLPDSKVAKIKLEAGRLGVYSSLETSPWYSAASSEV
jgi:hypothetical protein